MRYISRIVTIFICLQFLSEDKLCSERSISSRGLCGGHCGTRRLMCYNAWKCTHTQLSMKYQKLCVYLSDSPQSWSTATSPHWVQFYLLPFLLLCFFLCYRTWNEKLKELFWAFLSPPLLMLCLAGSIRNAGESSKTNMRSVFPCVCFSRVTTLLSPSGYAEFNTKAFRNLK